MTLALLRNAVGAPKTEPPIVEAAAPEAERPGMKGRGCCAEGGEMYDRGCFAERTFRRGDAARIAPLLSAVAAGLLAPDRGAPQPMLEPALFTCGGAIIPFNSDVERRLKV